jgi:hypothetical protein
MIINTDINILGGLPDFNLIKHYLFSDKTSFADKSDHYTFTAIKSDEAVKRFERAITRTLVTFKNIEQASLVRSMLSSESISHDSLYLLFWNASVNNELLNYLNSQVYFPSFYSGRLVIRKEEIGACIKDLKEKEEQLKEWTIVTIETVASKYLTLLKKFNLLEGSNTKKILHPYLSDKMFVLFIYWLTATETSSNLLESEWLKYCFCEQPIFIERVMQKKFAKFFQLTYTGDKLKIETTIPYQNIYDGVK